ncbi:translocation/assembly module TamB domain-containing protein [Wohlfahrtiimonas chitiniclastica]|uniref:translocation/assembly module TamB domain-containing protein n=1 Tax=Wohlfahrtiimonas chitiniclastica TaxID=400946 RepID=UPI001BCEE5D6|nr:translocation/assembly module TamB domain-containing protein [Wohlfahrtiimonas chitiniclastica]MBS7826944.1 translocation/assembly module TamB domain-containing protein [Wohlfahrtiimonas chitiniclastica]
MTEESDKKHTVAPTEAAVKPQRKSPWRWLKRFIYALVGLVVIVVGLIAFILLTESGLKLVNYGLKKSPLNEMVQIDELSGTLWRGIAFDRLYLQLNDDNHIELNHGALAWDLKGLLDRKVVIESVRLKSGDVMLETPGEPTPEDPNAPPFLPFSFERGQLPVDIYIQTVEANDVAVILPDLSVYVESASVKDGEISHTTWAFKDVLYQGLLNIGEEVTLPLNMSASIDADKVNDHINIRLKNATREMRVGDDYFDHAMSLILTGSLNDLTIHDSITFNWPNKLAKPLVIESAIDIRNQADVAWDLTLFNISNQLATTGQWSLSRPTEIQANLDLYLAQLKDAYPDISGALKGDFSIAGDVKKPLLSGDIKGHDIEGFGLILDELTVTAEHNEVQTTNFVAALNNLKFDEFSLQSGKVELHAEKIEQFDIAVTAKNIVDKEKTLIDQMTFTTVGSLETHDIDFKIRSIFNTTDFKGIGHVATNAEGEQEWTLDINRFDVYSDIIGRYTLLNPAKVVASSGDVSLSQLCLAELPTTICVQGQHHEGNSFGTLAVRRLQPKRINAFLPPEIQVNTTADLVVAGQFKDQKSFNGIVDASLSSGQIRYRMQGYEINVPLTKTQVLVRAKPEAITSTVDVDWGQYLQIHGGGSLDDPFGRQLVKAKIDGNAPTLKWILPIVPQLQKLEGQLTMQAEAAGELSQPKGVEVGFKMGLANGEIYNAEYNTLLKNIALNVVLNKGQPTLNITGGLMAGKGRMTILGDVDLVTLNANLKLRGDQLLLADSTNVKALVSPNADVTMRNGQLNIQGGLKIPELRFIYKSSDDPRGSVEHVSPDTIVISSKLPPPTDKEQPDFWKKASMNFNISLGDKVSVGAVGFVGKLTGGIDLKKSINEPLMAIGIINIGSGVYNVLGQELTLDKGRIQFTGLNMTNPNIEFQASRVFDNKRTGSKVSVGVRVTGTANNPKLNLFSQPTMPANSIVSYLALGTDVDSLTAIEVLQIAKMAQRIASGEIVTSPEDGFAKSVGLTDFGVMKDLSGNTSLGIGKYLTPNFYVGIGFSIFEESNGAFGIMRYNFLKYFSFDTQLSDEYSTIDLRFSKEI